MILDKINKVFSRKESTPLCLYPFMNVLMTADGRYKPCCRWSETLTNEGSELSVINGDSINDAWLSTEMESLRSDMLHNRKNRKCSVCWEEDRSGIRSMRFDSFNYGYTHQIDAQHESFPIRLDIYPSNRCNLRCRICSQHYSTGWIKEAKESLNDDGRVHENLSSINRFYIEKWLPNITEIGLFGGEPLYTEDCIELMNSMVSMGHSKRITLLINTNGTIYSDELISLFKKFKKVILNFSIDDVGARFEYQRKGANWSQTVKNLRSYLEHGGISGKSQIECKICCTVSAFNAFYLPETLTWFSDQPHPKIKVYLNVLHGPMSLSLRNLPNSAKELIEKKLISFQTGSRKESSQYRSVQNIVDFMNLRPEIPTESFSREVSRGDNYRKEKFATVFPELAEVLTVTSLN